MKPGNRVHVVALGATGCTRSGRRVAMDTSAAAATYQPVPTVTLVEGSGRWRRIGGGDLGSADPSEMEPHILLPGSFRKSLHVRPHGFRHTEICDFEASVKGLRCQSDQRDSSVNPASWAMRSSSDGHT